MSKNIFITATGTDVGKTYVSALIVKEMRKARYNCGYFKPVLSGIEEKNGKCYDEYRKTACCLRWDAEEVEDKYNKNSLAKTKKR